MDIPSVIRRLDRTPVTIGDNPFAKSRSVAYDVRKLFKYFTIPAFAVYVKDYNRQIVFQYNVSLSEDFYLLNVKQYQNGLTQFLISGGCMCIRYRVGETVHRYKLLDHRTDNWSFFELYTNQLIKKNFCIEFWADDFASVNEVKYGLLQDITFQTSNIYSPTTIPESPLVTAVDADAIMDRSELAITNSIYPAYVTFDNFGGLALLSITVPVAGQIVNGISSVVSLADLVTQAAAQINGNTVTTGFTAIADGNSLVIIPPDGAVIIGDPVFAVNVFGATDAIAHLPDAPPDFYPQVNTNQAWLTN